MKTLLYTGKINLSNRDIYLDGIKIQDRNILQTYLRQRFNSALKVSSLELIKHWGKILINWEMFLVCNLSQTIVLDINFISTRNVKLVSNEETFPLLNPCFQCIYSLLLSSKISSSLHRRNKRGLQKIILI